MSHSRTLYLSSFHLNRADRKELYAYCSYGLLQKDFDEFKRTENGWLIDLTTLCAAADQSLTQATKELRTITLPANLNSIVSEAVQFGTQTIIFHCEIDPNPELLIFNPHTDQVVTITDVRNGFKAPSVSFLQDRARLQLSRHPKDTKDMFNGWSLGQASQDLNGKNGLFILKDEYTLFKQSNDISNEREVFWSFEAVTEVEVPLGTFKRVFDQCEMYPTAMSFM